MLAALGKSLLSPFAPLFSPDGCCTDGRKGPQPVGMTPEAHARARKQSLRSYKSVEEAIEAGQHRRRAENLAATRIVSAGRGLVARRSLNKHISAALLVQRMARGHRARGDSTHAADRSCDGGREVARDDSPVFLARRAPEIPTASPACSATALSVSSDERLKQDIEKRSQRRAGKNFAAQQRRGSADRGGRGRGEVQIVF